MHICYKQMYIWYKQLQICYKKWTIVINECTFDINKFKFVIKKFTIVINKCTFDINKCTSFISTYMIVMNFHLRDTYRMNNCFRETPTSALSTAIRGRVSGSLSDAKKNEAPKSFSPRVTRSANSSGRNRAKIDWPAGSPDPPESNTLPRDSRLGYPSAEVKVTYLTSMPTRWSNLDFLTFFCSKFPSPREVSRRNR